MHILKLVKLKNPHLVCLSHTAANKIQVEDNVDLAYASYENTEPHNVKISPLIILHGLLCCKSNFNSLCKRYLEKTNPTRKIYALDLRNHGDSAHTNQYNYDVQIIDVMRFIEHMGLKTVSILGHDIGGRVAMLFALKYPDILEQLIVSEMSPVTTSQSFKKLSHILYRLQKLAFPNKTQLSEAKAFAGIQLAPIIKQPKLLSFLLANLIQQPDGSFSWRFNIKALLKNYEELASFPEVHNVVYNGPVLFVGGTNSDYIHKSDLPKIQTLFPNAELKYIEGAGHWLHSEKPNEFLEITLEFLNRPSKN